jgi:predicted LPLAT superfamily acyltransferase
LSPASFSPVLLIPCYNHCHELLDLWLEIEPFNLPTIVVDDGSDSHNQSALQQLEGKPNVWIVRHSRNQGKGAAVITGMQKAEALGYSHAVLIDADGQHNANDIPKFLAAATKSPESLVLGYPVFGNDAPWERVYCRQLCNLFLWLQTGSLAARDGMFGFRVYPIQSTLELHTQRPFKAGMGFDVEVIIRLMQSGIPSQSIASRVKYFPKGTSHYCYIRDNVEIFGTHTELILRRLLRTFSLSKIYQRCPRNNVASPSEWHLKPERGSYRGLRALFRLGRTLGDSFILALIPFITAYFFIVDRKACRASADYLARVAKKNSKLPSLSTYEHLKCFAYSIATWTSSWDKARRELPVPAPSPELAELEKRLVNGKGGIILSAHFGQLESLRAYLHAAKLQGKVSEKLEVIPMMYHGNSHRFRSFLESINPASSQDIIHVDSISPASISDMQEQIAKGKYIAILADRLPSSGNTRTLDAMFLDEKVEAPFGPFLLAYLLKVEVISLFCYSHRGADRYRFKDITPPAGMNRADYIRRLADEYMYELEQACLDAPLEWFNFYDYFSSTPKEARKSLETAGIASIQIQATSGADS